MTNQEILEKAIQKAIAGGWDSFGVDWDEWGIDGNGMINDKDYYVTLDYTVPEIVFNHDFAKSIWGDEERKTIKETKAMKHDRITKQGWRHYIQQMVIADDPIKYLGKNLPTTTKRKANTELEKI